MKPILTDLNLFGKRIFDVHSLEVTGEPTSDRHVLTRLRGQIIANLSRDEAILQSKIDIDEAVAPLVTKAIYEAAIAALNSEIELTKPTIQYFINEEVLSYDWVAPDRRPLVEVGVLNTTQTINNSSVTVTDNDSHKYSGTYNTVGSLAIDTSGNWSSIYAYQNAYKHISELYYIVFNQSNLTWQIIEAANPHTSVGESAASVTVQLGSQSSLPSSFGDYIIDTNFENIDSLEFLTADVPIQYDDTNHKVLIDFSGHRPSGYVILK
ncbi:hypothetical protein VP150E351_P0041 [Vibrio phage 150E35-1]|nr:hypothetical protein VP150E351_P0041 [Vibrio phage 150E35-1]